MKRRRCKYGKLKKRIGSRRCRKAPARRTRAKRSKRSKRRSGLRRAAGLGIGTLGLMAAGAIGAYKFWESRGA